MREITTTFVGLDAHKVSISVAMLIPGEGKPVEWQCTNVRASVRRMVKKVPGARRRAVLLRGRTSWVRAAAVDLRRRGGVCGGGSLSHPAQTWGKDQDGSARRARRQLQRFVGRLLRRAGRLTPETVGRLKAGRASAGSSMGTKRSEGNR